MKKHGIPVQTVHVPPRLKNTLPLFCLLRADAPMFSSSATLKFGREDAPAAVGPAYPSTPDPERALPLKEKEKEEPAAVIVAASGGAEGGGKVCSRLPSTPEPPYVPVNKYEEQTSPLADLTRTPLAHDHLYIWASTGHSGGGGNPTSARLRNENDRSAALPGASEEDYIDLSPKKRRCTRPALFS